MGGYEHFWAERWSTNGVYSVGDGRRTSRSTPDDVNRRLTYGAINLLYWFLGDRAWTGVEYLYGRREVFGGDPRPARHTGCSMRFASIFPDGRLRLGIGAAVVLSAALAAAQTDAPPAVYRARTDLVVLQVAVSDAQRRFVPGLLAENFTVFDEGVPQRVSVFATSDSPLDVMLLMDTSGSMQLRIPVAKRAAADLVGTLRSGDRAGLILFDVGATVAHPLSDNHDSVIAAIRAASPAGATALYEAVYLALHTLSRLRQADTGIRRQALIVLTDGDDNASRIPFEQALDAARTGDVTIFMIVPGALPQDVPVTLSAGWHDRTTRFEMRRLAEDTGGRAFVTTDLEGLAGVYEQIGSELRAQVLARLRAGCRPTRIPPRVRPREQSPGARGADTYRVQRRASCNRAALEPASEGTVTGIPGMCGPRADDRVLTRAPDQP